MPKGKPFTVLSLGGSLIYPDDSPDVRFLRRFVDLIRRRVDRGERFALICGGGKVCRRYQAAASKLRPMSDEELDWLGIRVTQLNAHFMRTVLGDLAHGDIVENPTAELRPRRPVVVGAGWKPGCSTDHDAVLLAENLGADTIVNLTNIDYVYDSDPRTNPDARPIERMSWKELRRMFDGEWKPGLNSPFDPVASRRAERLGLRVVTANGRRLANLERILDGREFRGTVIE